MGDTAQTPGIVRRKAFDSEGVWAGVGTTAPGAISGWHHHGEHTTYLYVRSGRFKLESGPGGRDVFVGEPGDFIRIPARLVHRESNTAGDEGVAVVFRVGGGPVVVNVEGPDPV